MPGCDDSSTIRNFSVSVQRRRWTLCTTYTVGYSLALSLDILQTYLFGMPRCPIETGATPHPAWGCVRLSNHLKLEGISVSSPTIQNILIKNGMSSKYDRWLKLEQKRAGEAIELTGEQVAFIEKQNPAFRERHVESSRPGELLCQDTFYVGRLKGVGKVYLHVVVDSFSSYAFGVLHTAKRPEAAVAVLHNDALPFYAEREIPVSAILTDNGREFCGTPSHSYEIYLELNDIEHRRWTLCITSTVGYSLALCLDIPPDLPLRYAEVSGRNGGYSNRNMGRRSIDTINLYLESVSKEG